MKKSLITFSALLLFVCAFSLTSCKKEPDCKSCSAVQEIYQDGVLITSQDVSAVEFCDDELAEIEANPEVTVTQTVAGFTQTTTTKYTCQ